MSVILFSCNKTGKKANEFSNDMDNVKIWGSSSSVVKGFAHSGSYASKLDSVTEFSFGMQTVFENVVNKIPKKINVTLWVYSLRPNPDATVVLSVNSNGQPKYWKNLGLNGVTKAREWTEINASFDVPDNLDIKDGISIYIWNPNKQELYIDDFDISFE